MQIAQQELFQVAVESSPTAMVMIDRHGVIRLVSKKTESLFGFSRDELLGQPVEMLVPVQFREGHPKLRSSYFYQPVARSMGAGRDLFGVRKDGTEIPVEIGLNPVETDEGMFVLAAVVDITKRKRAEIELRTINQELKAKIAERERMQIVLRERDERIRSVLDSTAEGIYGLDLDGNCTFANAACARMIGIDRPEDLIGVPMHDLIHHTRPDGSPHADHDCPIFQAIRRGEGVHVDDEVFWRTDGSSFPAEYWSRPIRRDDALIGAVVTFVDVTIRKRAEEELASYADKLKCSNADLEQFAYAASHDLQEPLRAISGYCQLLEMEYKGQLDAQADDWLTSAVEGAQRMQTLITDLLTYSRIGRRDQPFRLVDCNVAAATAVRNLEASIAESNAKVSFGNLPTVRADMTQLVQLFQNLIGNSIKFHGDKTPEVHVAAEMRDGEWLFSVRDNGIGIDVQYVERIFMIFQRLHNRERYSGTGIGLAVCKRIVERHGGMIWVESKPQKGSIFCFTLSRPAQAAAGDRKDASSDAVRI